MKKLILSFIAIFLFNDTVLTWGFFSLHKINKMAVYTLTESMNTLSDGMVERQIRKSFLAIGCIWY